MDDLDRAKELEMHQRQVAINNTLNAETLPSQLKDEKGRVICLECGVLIPAGRLKAKPKAVHCIDCRYALEQKQKQYKNKR